VELKICELQVHYLFFGNINVIVLEHEETLDHTTVCMYVCTQVLSKSLHTSIVIYTATTIAFPLIPSSSNSQPNNLEVVVTYRRLPLYFQRSIPAHNHRISLPHLHIHLTRPHTREFEAIKTRHKIHFA
jgi:hypothetical protein